jgi:hypothetical protein
MPWLSLSRPSKEDPRYKCFRMPQITENRPREIKPVRRRPRRARSPSHRIGVEGESLSRLCNSAALDNSTKVNIHLFVAEEIGWG